MPAKKQITKEMILDTALALLKEDGIEAVNVKRLAGALHCSTQPIYLSFASMEQLREELIPSAIRAFEDGMRSNSPDHKVRLYGTEYIMFAKNEPKLFGFLFMRANAFTEIRPLLLPIIESSVMDLMEKYRIDHTKADYLHDQLWMHAHGIASMIATDFCDWNMDKADRMLTECTAAFTKEYEI